MHDFGCPCPQRGIDKEGILDILLFVGQKPQERMREVHIHFSRLAKGRRKEALTRILSTVSIVPLRPGHPELGIEPASPASPGQMAEDAHHEKNL